MNKYYVVDTNVFLDNPEAINAFEDNTLIIPEVVLEELDNFKKGRETINVNARTIARTLQRLKENAKQGENLLTGVSLPNQGTLFIKSADISITLPVAWDVNKRDNEILRTCLTLKQEVKEEVILVSKDVFLRIKADVLNIRNEEYKTEQVCRIEEQYTGRMDVYLSEEDFLTYVKNGYINVEKAYQVLTTDTEYEEYYAVKDFNVYPNEFVVIKNANGNGTMLGMMDANAKYIEKLKFIDCHPFGLTPKSVNQIFLQEALMRNDIKCVCVKGAAGSGKSLFGLACGLEKVMDPKDSEDTYHNVLVYQPYKVLEDDIGYLPGTKEEKILDNNESIFDSVKFLLGTEEDTEMDKQDKVQELLDRQIIKADTVSFIRGRTLYNAWVIVDEAQNLTQKTCKTICCRLADSSKIIYNGDVEQTDASYLTPTNNGLAYISEKFKESALCATITMSSETDVVRSALAKEALKYLD